MTYDALRTALRDAIQQRRHVPAELEGEALDRNAELQRTGDLRALEIHDLLSRIEEINGQ